MRRASGWLLIGLALCWSATAVPAEEPPTDAASLEAKEKEARTKAAEELAAVARFCVGKSGFEEARQAYEKAIELTPDDAALASELEKLKSRHAATRPAVVPQIEDRRAKGLAHCTQLLAPVAAAFAGADRTEDLERICSLLRVIGAPPPILDVAFYEPYLEWHAKSDVEKLAAGWERIDGAWVDPAKVEEMNRAHSDWTNPWLVADDAFEVRTTQPLRVARQALRNVGEFRRVFLRAFAGEWDLRPTTAKLRLFVTQTRAELDERVRCECPSAPAAPGDAVAWYCDTPAAGNPSFACLECLDAKDHAVKLEFRDVRWALLRETARQMAFEYSKHVKGLGRVTHGAVWAIEGFAEFAPYLQLAGGRCTVARPSSIPSRGRDVESSFCWCRGNVDKIPALDDLVRMTAQKFHGKPENAHAAATLVLYLLEGREHAYRSGFLKFMEAVHGDRDDADTFAACLPGVDVAKLDAEFRAFCKDLRVAER